MSASTPASIFTLVFNVPESHVAACKTAILAAGAGRCWTTLGAGQFRPGDTANPHIGCVGELEHVPEVRVEAPCVGEDAIKKVVEALKGYVPLVPGCGLCS
jgi:hypothetical protein